MERFAIKFLGSDKKRFEHFVHKLARDTQAKLVRQLDNLEILGPELQMPASRKIGASLWELRIRGRQEVRVIYSIRRNEVWLVTWFVKKSNKIPKEELDLARKKLTSL